MKVSRAAALYLRPAAVVEVSRAPVRAVEHATKTAQRLAEQCEREFDELPSLLLPDRQRIASAWLAMPSLARMLLRLAHTP
jgi:hypothetical protein